jgi:16S rRNA pseudouridine516 synthase
MRLDAYLRHVRGLSKKEAQKRIKQGVIRCNDTVIKDPKHAIHPTVDRVFEGATELGYAEHYTYMVYKPSGVITAHRDTLHATLFDVIDVPPHPGLHAMGRLDKETTGLLLVTTDGTLTHRLMHGKKHLGKRYKATVDRPLDDVSALLQPMRLTDGHGRMYETQPALVHSVEGTTIRLTIFEGKTHQVKKMLAQLGAHVVALHREAIGTLELDPRLQPGESVRLSSDQLAQLKEAA